MQSVTWKFDAYGEPDKVLGQVTESLAAPGAGQALVRLRAIGMNRSEFNYVQGKYLPARDFPSALGQEAVGEVVALGDSMEGAGACRIKVGDRVALTPGKIDMCATGTYRDVGIYAQDALIPVPDNFGDAEGAAFWMAFLTVAGSFRNAAITPVTAPGKRLLVTAASSSVGVMALKLGRLWGAHTIATTRSHDKAAVLEQFADEVMVCESAGQFAEQLKSLGGFDVAIDPVGGDFVDAMVASASQGAVIVSYEMISGGRAQYSIGQVLVKDLTIRGFALFNIFRCAGLCEELVELGLAHAADLVPVIASTAPLEDAPAALVKLGDAQHIGKFILLPKP
jgi:NADPH2:quinone reductase